MKFRIIMMLLNVAASTFGVLQIHANSDAMRTWLWQNLLRNVDFYDSRWLIVHAFGSVISVFAVCTVIDVVRRSIAGKMIRQQM